MKNVTILNKLLEKALVLIVFSKHGFINVALVHGSLTVCVT